MDSENLGDGLMPDQKLELATELERLAYLLRCQAREQMRPEKRPGKAWQLPFNRN